MLNSEEKIYHIANKVNELFELAPEGSTIDFWNSYWSDVPKQDVQLVINKMATDYSMIKKEQDWKFVNPSYYCKIKKTGLFDLKYKEIIKKYINFQHFKKTGSLKRYDLIENSSIKIRSLYLPILNFLKDERDKNLGEAFKLKGLDFVFKKDLSPDNIANFLLKLKSLDIIVLKDISSDENLEINNTPMLLEVVKIDKLVILLKQDFDDFYNQFCKGIENIEENSKEIEVIKTYNILYKNNTIFLSDGVIESRIKKLNEGKQREVFEYVFENPNKKISREDVSFTKLDRLDQVIRNIFNKNTALMKILFPTLQSNSIVFKNTFNQQDIEEDVLSIQ
ncbi:MAG: hypothetical protein N4A44_00990 [Alphaproteobacteria bacterium]|jgi:hypothetical protein|nr:hypothetical protein [Alphaproteobacteria bacterium]